MFFAVEYNTVEEQIIVWAGSFQDLVLWKAIAHSNHFLPNYERELLNVLFAQSRDSIPRCVSVLTLLGLNYLSFFPLLETA